MCITRYSLGHGLLCAERLYELHHEPWLLLHRGNTMIMLYDEIMLWLCYGYVVAAATAAASARREAVLWLPCQPGENKCVCGSYGSSSLLPAS